MPIQYFCEYCRERIEIGRSTPTATSNLHTETMVIARYKEVDHVNEDVYHAECFRYIRSLHGRRRIPRMADADMERFIKAKKRG